VAVTVAFVPSQVVGEFTLTVGIAFTVTVAAEDVWEPHCPVTTTRYLVAVADGIVNVDVVALGFPVMLA
jgi:hypothetical protein